MITGELKSKIDAVWNTVYSNGISNPLTVIEQLSYLLFIKRLDEMHTLAEAKANRSGLEIESPVFTPQQSDLRWSRFKELAPKTMLEAVRDQVFPFIKSINSGDGMSSYAFYMKDATFLVPTGEVLASVVDQLDAIDMSDADTKGDLYEYMLGNPHSITRAG